MYKLDQKDRKILYELDVNARQSYSQIARKVKLSKEVVRYRIENLIKNKVIFGFLLIVDSRRLGFFNNKVFVTLQNMSEKEEYELISYLINNKHIVFVVRTDGRYDLVFSVMVRDVEELNRILIDIENKFGQYFNEKVVSTILGGYYFNRDYLLNKKSGLEKKPCGFGLSREAVEIDDIDKKILLSLSYHPRISLVEISKKIGYSADGVNLRIKKLEKNGIIQNYILILNNSEIKQFHYKILIDLKNFTEQAEKKLLQFCIKQPNIYYACKTLTPWKFEIDMEVQSPEHYREILKEIKNIFGEIIKETTPLHVFKIYKYNLLPSIVKYGPAGI